MNTLTEWLQRHDLTIDLATIWLVIVSAFVIAIGLLDAWWELRGTHDQTDVGRTLKWQKASLSIALAANGIYWCVVLAAYYTGYAIDTWEKTLLRIVFAGGMLVGAVYVSLFTRALRRESRNGDQQGSIPLSHDAPTTNSNGGS